MGKVANARFTLHSGLAAYQSNSRCKGASSGFTLQEYVHIYIYMYTHHCILSFILSFSTLRTTSQQLARHLKQRLKRQPPSGVREELMGQAVQMRLTLYFSIVCVVDEFGLRFGRSLLTRLPISQRYFLRANSKDRVLIVLIRFALLLVEQTLQSSRSTIP